MKKSLISLAVVAGLAASGVANAAPTAYGFIDVSLNSISDNTNTGATGGNEDNMNLSSNTSAIGLKGSEDLGDGVKAIYKVEFQVDVTDRVSGGSTTDRDQFVGLKGGMGKVIFGTASSNYKQMGGKIDPFYRTAIQARSVGQQSPLHSGTGLDGGRMDKMVQYTSPNFGGISVVLNTTFQGNDDEASGIGVRYKTKGLDVWVDALSGVADGSGALGGSFDSATKVGAKFKATKEITVGGQYETVDFVGGGDTTVLFLSGTFAMDKNNTIALTYGATEDTTAGFSAGIWHKMSKMTSVYAAFNSMSEDTAGSGNDGSIIVAGIRKKF